MLPVKLIELQEKYPKVIKDIDDEREDGNGYWIYLHPGYIWDGETHFIHEDTAADCIDAFKAVKPCDCAECRQLLGKSPKKTRQEVEALKANWLEDPCFPIAAITGFEAYYEELKAFQQAKEAEWEAANLQRLNDKAAKLGVPGNTELANYVLWLEGRLDALESQLDELLNGKR